MIAEEERDPTRDREKTEEKMKCVVLSKGTRKKTRGRQIIYFRFRDDRRNDKRNDRRDNNRDYRRRRDERDPKDYQKTSPNEERRDNRRRDERRYRRDDKRQNYRREDKRGKWYNNVLDEREDQRKQYSPKRDSRGSDKGKGSDKRQEDSDKRRSNSRDKQEKRGSDERYEKRHSSGMQSSSFVGSPRAADSPQKIESDNMSS
jgi:hypothetical protein